MSPTICFVIPYFGKWPFWLPFYFESCRMNPSINWLLYTDCVAPEDTPENVRIVNMSYSSYCAMVSASLQIAFAPPSPYKLCDLKPALGYIHREELKGFDFWAFGDIDLIYGNLRHYFTDDRLARHDIFSTHQRRISGHCCLLRNTSLMREAFTHVKNWKELLSSPKHQWFDESAFSRLFVRHKNWPQALADLAKPLSRWTRRIENVEAFSTPYARIPWTDGSHHFPSEWHWDNGRLTNDRDGDRQFPYFHFVVWKKRAWDKNPAVVDSATPALATSGSWTISENGFSVGREKPSPPRQSPGAGTPDIPLRA